MLASRSCSAITHYRKLNMKTTLQLETESDRRLKEKQKSQLSARITIIGKLGLFHRHARNLVYMGTI